MKNSKIKVFYNEKQVNLNKNIISTTSRSPLKPYLLMKTLDGLGFGNNLDIDGSFEPFKNEDFEIAHFPSYVEGFFNGTPNVCTRNGLPWSVELADSVRYTNASLYNAIRHAYLNPDQVTLSPTSGFHHAAPSGGQGFCTFAGQVIAAVKLYREFGAAGAVLDLDGHFGNSIEDCRSYTAEIDKAIPRGFNVNPRGSDAQYHSYLVSQLEKIEEAVLKNEIQYVMWCHGADSHAEDDLGGQVSTKWWVECSTTFYEWVAQLDAKLIALGRSPLPVTLSLFGGYRKDDYGSVISLHVKDIVTCMNVLCGHSIRYAAKVAKKTYASAWNHNQTTGFGYSAMEQWIDGMPISVLRMINPKKYMSNEDFKKTKMIPNEVKLLAFLKENPDAIFDGNTLGQKVNGWKNHSMGKWAQRLVRRGLIQFKKGQGYLYQSPVNPMLNADNFKASVIMEELNTNS